MPATAVSCGLFVDNAPTALVPLEHVDVRARILGAHARVVCTQRYRNHDTRPVEAVYVFPVDEAAAVCGFAATVNGVRYEGTVQTREQAFATYDDALAAGHGGYLLDEEQPDVFRASVGNIVPGSEVHIELTYVTELAFEGDAVRFTLPTTLSPRYAPAADRTGVGPTPAEVLNPPRLLTVPYGLSLSIDVRMPGPIRRIESPSHPIAVEQTDGHAVVTLGQQTTALDRDLVLVITSPGAGDPQVVVERTGGDRVAALTFRPTFPSQPVPADVVFVVDRSASMNGSSIDQVRNALQLCLRSLDTGCRFNILGFGSSYDVLFDCCREYDAATLDEAARYVANMQASMGGTEILPALEAAFRQGGGHERPLQVLLLTDGQVTDADAVIAAVRRQQGRVRVFTFGIGHGAGRHLVTGVARAGQGAAEFIAPGERIEEKVLRQFRRVFSPALDDVRLEWSNAPVLLASAPPRHLYDGDPLRLYAWLGEGPGTVTLRARGPAGPLAWTLDLGAVPAVEGRTVPTLAARTRIRDLEAGGEWPGERGSLQRERRAGAAVSEIVRLAKAYGLSSRETSWVAVEVRDVPTEGEPVLRTVPVALVSGWGGMDALSPLILARSAPKARPRVEAALFASSTAETEVCPPLGMLAIGDAPPVRTPIEEKHESAPQGPGMAARLGRAFGLGRLRRERPTPPYVGRAAGTPAAVPTSSTSSNRPLDRLVALQQAEGWWELTEELAAILERPLADLTSQLPAGADAVTRRAWATALALAFLERHAAAEAGEWAMLAAKARRWLGVVAGGDWLVRAQQVVG